MTARAFRPHRFLGLLALTAVLDPLVWALAGIGDWQPTVVAYFYFFPFWAGLWVASDMAALLRGDGQATPLRALVLWAEDALVIFLATALGMYAAPLGYPLMNCDWVGLGVLRSFVEDARFPVATPCIVAVLVPTVVWAVALCFRTWARWRMLLLAGMVLCVCGYVADRALWPNPLFFCPAGRKTLGCISTQCAPENLRSLFVVLPFVAVGLMVVLAVHAIKPPAAAASSDSLPLGLSLQAGLVGMCVGSLGPILACLPQCNVWCFAIGLVVSLPHSMVFRSFCGQGGHVYIPDQQGLLVMVQSAPPLAGLLLGLAGYWLARLAKRFLRTGHRLWWYLMVAASMAIPFFGLLAVWKSHSKAAKSDRVWMRIRAKGFRAQIVDWYHDYEKKTPKTEASLPRVLGVLHFPGSRLAGWVSWSPLESAGIGELLPKPDDCLVGTPKGPCAWRIVLTTDRPTSEVLSYYRRHHPYGSALTDTGCPTFPPSDRRLWTVDDCVTQDGRSMEMHLLSDDRISTMVFTIRANSSGAVGDAHR